MVNKIILLISLVIIFSCSSTRKIIKKNDGSKNTTRLINYSGISAIDDTYLKSPCSIVSFNDNLLISDSGNNLIRQIRGNRISTYAGNGIKQNIDGELPNSSFDTPEDIIVDSENNIYVVVGYDQIRKIDIKGNTTMYAGKYTPGWVDGGIDGQKDSAIFKSISALKIDTEDNIYVADKNKIRKISKEGNIITISGGNESGDKIGKPEIALYNQISDLTVSKTGEVFVVDQVNKKIKKISNDGIVSVFIDKGIFNWPSAIEIDNQGNIVVFDSSTKKLYLFNTKGKLIKTIKNEKLSLENYYFKVKMYIDKNDDIIIPSKNFINIIDKNFQITQIGTKNGFKKNGNIKEATFNIPYDGVFNKKGNLFVLDRGNYLIRKISTNGMVSDYSGNGHYGSKDGNSTTCKFKSLQSIAIDNKSNLYVLDGDWKDTKIRKIDTLGSTTTFIDPKTQKINWERPSDLVLDSQNNIYITDSKSNKIYKIDASKNIEEYITPVHVKLNSPHGLTIDKDNNLYVCDSYNNRIVKISKDKTIKFINSKNNILFNEPENITIDDLGNLYVTDKNRTRIIKVSNDSDLKIIIKESILGENKSKKLSEYYNSLKIEYFENKLFIFDKYDNKIIMVK